jgi:hypothetical protein
MSSESANEYSISGSVEFELDVIVAKVKTSQEIGYSRTNSEAEETS